eukprot:s829_g15.t1
MDFGARGIGGEIKLFPPPLYHGELDKWDDWSRQLKRYEGLCKPLAKTMMDEIETNAQKVVTDSLREAYDVQQTGTQNNQLSLFSKQLAYMLAQITDGAARAIVRNEDTENGICESAGALKRVATVVADDVQRKFGNLPPLVKEVPQRELHKALVEAAEAYEPLEHRSFEELEDSAADSLNRTRPFLSGGFG